MFWIICFCRLSSLSSLARVSKTANSSLYCWFAADITMPMLVNKKKLKSISHSWMQILQNNKELFRKPTWLGGEPSKYYTGRLYPKVQPLTLLYRYIILDRKGNPFINLLLTFNCFKCTVIKIWINHKTRRFSQLFHSHNKHVLALLGLFTNRNTLPYPYPSTYSRSEKGTPFRWSLPYRPL